MSQPQPRFSFLARPPSPAKLTKNHRERTRTSSWKQLSSTSRIELNADDVDRSTYSRYITRSLLNILGPLILVGIYSFIVMVYFLHPAINNVSPHRPIGPKGLFFTWTVISVFLIDWAKSGAAGLEAALMAKPRWWAPSDAQQLMWHADRSWGALDGWFRAIYHCITYKRGDSSKLPSFLWIYLCISNLLLYIAIPLAGLSLDTKSTYTLSNRTLPIIGANQSTFNFKTTYEVATNANARWRRGEPTTGEQASILYAPHGTVNASATYFDDIINSIYNQDLNSSPVKNRAVEFFTGPTVTERAHGNAWGLKTIVSCWPTNPYTGLKNMWFTSVEDWIGTLYYGQNLSTWHKAAQNYTGLSPIYMFFDGATNLEIRSMLAVDVPFERVREPEYNFTANLPLQGSIEVATWQSYFNAQRVDGSWKNITDSPYVVTSVAYGEDDIFYEGHGVRCEVESTTGTADLDAASRTFSNFQILSSDDSLSSNPGEVAAIQSVVFSALSTATFGANNTPSCVSAWNQGQFGCGPWYGANEATGGATEITRPSIGSKDFERTYETITAERMTLAMYKLFGEAAVAMMEGPADWQGGMKGLDATTDLVVGLIPWQIPFGLLIAWAISVVVPSMLTFGERRFASTVGGFEMFRLGAEWKEVQMNEKRKGTFSRHHVIAKVGSSNGIIQSPQSSSSTPITRGGVTHHYPTFI